ncbi:MAG: four-carbon acid sugar kinase family protein [Burkholderiaceae bacterium]|nr:four-carbon acid sugar kinase family protein [Burkholderiaceae bacterium]
MTMLLLGAIADDFTGATDLANTLVRGGLRCVQTIGVPDGQLDTEADAVVVALKSRTIAAADAVAQSLAALRWLQAQHAEQIYFKYCSTFDSTPQGNIGPVTEALLDTLHGPGQGFTIACPAFPTNQRTVFKGHLFVGDVLLSDSGMRNHPLTPMTDANLVRVLQAQTQRKVGLVAHEVIAQGVAAIRKRFDGLRADGVGIAVLDAISDADLMQIGLALADVKLVTAGSGIAMGLPQNWVAHGALAHANVQALPAVSGRDAVVSGSCSVATNAQVRHFRDQGRPALQLDPMALAASDDALARALAWCDAQPPDGPLLVYATAEPAEVQRAQAELGVARAGELVEHALARIARGLVERGVRRLVVAGGETSGAVVQALGITQLAIGAQIDPGVPWTAARSPACNGDWLHLALKSGNFGSTDFFTKAFA